MDNKQKNELIRLRANGMFPTEISKITGIPLNTVKTYFKRHRDKMMSEHIKCPVCGKKIITKKGVRNKKFCSDGCRMNYWNSHQDLVKKKAYYHLRCIHCGKEFTSYGNSKRKYCSRSCYLEAIKRG